MIKGFKIRLIPNKEQEELMIKSIGCSRFVYNWALNKCNENYKNNIKYNMSDIRKEFTQLKKQKEYKWLNEVSNTTMVESMRNLDKSFKSFFKGTSKYPKFKSKKKSKQSFYVRYNTLYFINNMCNIEKIGKVKYKTNYKKFGKRVFLVAGDNVLRTFKGGRVKEMAKIDVALPCFHGINGEDGSISGLLQLSNLPYTCGNSFASRCRSAN